jgi:hypothetical protein
MKTRMIKLVLIAAALGIGVLMLYDTYGGKAAVQERSSAVFDADGKMKLPTGFRKWVFVGAPLTPEGLNDGKYNCDAAASDAV